MGMSDGPPPTLDRDGQGEQLPNCLPSLKEQLVNTGPEFEAVLALAKATDVGYMSRRVHGLKLCFTVDTKV